MKTVFKLLTFCLIISKSGYAQKYDIDLVSKDSELNFAKTQKRGIKKNDIIYYVEKDLQTISAYKNNELKWQTNIISICGKPKVGEPKIRYVGYNTNKLLVVIGKHNFAEIDTRNGETKLVGSD